MKKGKMRLYGALALALVCSIAMNSAWAETVKSDMSILLEGKPLEAAQAGYLIDNSLFVPYRAIAEAIGATIGWEEATRTVSSAKEGNTVSFAIDAREATVNGTAVATDVAATIIEGSTYVPVRFLAETLGLQVGYDQASRTVSLNEGAAPSFHVFGVKDGDTLQGGTVQVSVAAYNHKLTDFTKSPAAVEGEGHIHLWLDTDANDPKAAVKSFDGEPVVFDNVAPGEHTLTVQLVGNDHKPVLPEVKQTIEFRAEGEAAYSIESTDFQFAPVELTVKAGATVRFTNRDDVKHNIVAEDGSFRTDLIGQGETVEFTAPATPGVYEFYCAPHRSFMKGKLIVQ